MLRAWKREMEKGCRLQVVTVAKVKVPVVKKMVKKVERDQCLLVERVVVRVSCCVNEMVTVVLKKTS